MTGVTGEYDDCYCVDYGDTSDCGDCCGDCVECVDCVDYGDMSSYEVSEPYDLVSSPSSTALSLHL